MYRVRKSTYITEIYHVDENNTDSGVMYCEMQDSELQMDAITNKKIKEILYSKNSSYLATTGGLLKDIRENCSIEKIKALHKQFYHINNMFITVSGFIEHEQLLAEISRVEEQNISSIPSGFIRPSHSQTPAITIKTEEIDCPTNDIFGMVKLLWIGPAGSNWSKIRAVQFLIDYITDALEWDLIKNEDPYCKSLSISLKERKDCEIIATFVGVPQNKLKQLKKRFFEKFVVDHSKKEAFEMKRISSMIDDKMRNFRNEMADCPHSFISNAVIGHQLYGSLDENDQENDLKERLDEVIFCKMIIKFYMYLAGLGVIKK
ncbi:unnamed protein product [Meloidogyne enterolobii]|uniref:Uncharacterized protein n=1 Tax=Meloidogyne enterolobii TaxID=390850 RepID=A0ACB1AXL7_MELEN